MISYDDVKENLTGILMSAQQSVCPTDVDDISDALTLIEQLQARVVELESKLAEHDAEVAKAAIRTALRNLGAPNITESSIQIFANEYAERMKRGDV